MMTLSYNFGLTAGSLLAYVIELMLNPIETHPCGPVPFDVKLQTLTSNSTLSTSTYTTTPSSSLTTIMSTLVSTITDISTNTSSNR